MDAFRSEIVTVFGGTGFIGRHVVRELAARGYRIRVATRRPDLAHHLQPLGTFGQIRAIQANLRHAWSVDRAVQGASHVVNLVGILAESGKQRFHAVQAEGAQAVAEAARASDAKLVHVSAIGADAESPSEYARSKAVGERHALDARPDAIVMRPSIVFGPEDDFFNRFGGMARLAPALPLIGGGKTRFQPVYVGDVADAVARAVAGEAKPGTVYELGGPDVMTFRECLEELLRVINRKRFFVPLPFGLASLLASVAQYLPGSPLTPDQVALLRSDNVVSDAARAEGRTLEGLGIRPTDASVVLPTYLVRFRPHGQFEPSRGL